MSQYAAVLYAADVDWSAPEQAQEVITGFYLLEAQDLDEAVALAAQIPAAWNGAVEVRPVKPLTG